MSRLRLDRHSAVDRLLEGSSAVGLRAPDDLHHDLPAPLCTSSQHRAPITAFLLSAVILSVGVSLTW